MFHILSSIIFYVHLQM